MKRDYCWVIDEKIHRNVVFHIPCSKDFSVALLKIESDIGDATAYIARSHARAIGTALLRWADARRR